MEGREAMDTTSDARPDTGAPSGETAPPSLLRTVAEAVRRQLSQLPGKAATEEPPDVDVPLADLGLDSLRLVGLLVSLEQDLGVELPPEEINAESFRTVRTLADAVARVAGAPEADTSHDAAPARPEEERHG